MWRSISNPLWAKNPQPVQRIHSHCQENKCLYQVLKFLMIALWMLEFSFFEVFLCCAEGEAESAEITATSMKYVLKHANMVLLDLCLIQGCQNVLGSLECTQKAAGYLQVFGYCISDHIACADTAGLESQSLDGMPVYIEGFVHALSSLNHNLDGIKTCVASTSSDRCWRNHTSYFWSLRCSLAQAMTTYSIPLSKSICMKPLWILLP